MKQTKARWAWLVLGAWLFVAIFAGVLASDRPITCVWQGERRWPALQAIGQQYGLLPYEAATQHADWSQASSAIWPPIRFAPSQMNIKLGAVSPQQGHLLGTDHLGRDVAAGIVGGAAVAMKVGLLSTFFAAVIGLLLGGWAGFRGGRRGGWRDPDSWLMRVLEIYQSLPTLLVLLVLAGLVGRMNELRISLIIAMLEWPAFARLARTEMRRVREMSYIEAARSLGLGSFRTWWRHALPNSVAPILVLSAFAVAVAVLLEASLSFLGIGLPPEQVSWGSMMGLVRHHPNMWWLALAPGLVLSVVLLALSVAGEVLRQRRERR